MRRIFKTKNKTKYLPPGTLVAEGKKSSNEKVKISVVNYNKKTVEVLDVNNIKDCIPHIKNSECITWINTEGLSDSKVIKSVG